MTESSTTTLAKTPLHAWHEQHGGRMVDFAGWSMPVQYGSIVTEHLATRNAATLFDVSHMGRFRFEGSGSAAFLDGLITRRVTNIKPGQIRYGLVTNKAGGILDDILVYHLTELDDSPYFQLVVNASNRAKIAAVVETALAAGAAGVSFSDVTEQTAMIAVQGPHAIDIANAVVESDIGALKYYNGGSFRINGQSALVSRTGYTGEDGCEIIVAAEYAGDVWQQLMSLGESRGLIAAGLGARDTLRLEAAMPLYGHELTEDIHPFQAGLGFAVHLKDREFTGSSALREKKQQPHPVRVGLKMDGKRVPREHYAVFAGDTQVGEVTSGTFSPTFECPLAMAYVTADSSAEGTELTIDIRGKRLPATVVPLPFYTRPG